MNSVRSFLFVAALTSGAAFADPEIRPGIFAPEKQESRNSPTPVDGASSHSGDADESLVHRAVRDSIRYEAPRAAVPEVTESSNSAVAASSPILMAPLIVRGVHAPDLSLRRENDVDKFFRTGTFFRIDGKDISTELWAKGDRGVMLSFMW